MVTNGILTSAIVRFLGIAYFFGTTSTSSTSTCSVFLWWSSTPITRPWWPFWNEEKQFYLKGSKPLRNRQRPVESGFLRFLKAFLKKLKNEKHLQNPPGRTDLDGRQRCAAVFWKVHPVRYQFSVKFRLCQIEKLKVFSIFTLKSDDNTATMTKGDKKFKTFPIIPLKIGEINQKATYWKLVNLQPCRSSGPTIYR